MSSKSILLQLGMLSLVWVLVFTSIVFVDYWTRARSLAMLVSDSLTNSCLVHLIDVTMACEDAYSKLEVVTVAGVGNEDCVGNSLLQIWKLRFGHKS